MIIHFIGGPADGRVEEYYSSPEFLYFSKLGSLDGYGNDPVEIHLPVYWKDSQDKYGRWRYRYVRTRYEHLDGKCRIV